jgi:cytochrome c oxidase subunit 2
VEFGSLTGSLTVPAALQTAPLAVGRAGTWLPEAAAAGAAEVDRPFLGLYLVSAFAVVLVTGLALTYVLQYRRRDDAARGGAGGRPNPALLGVWLLAALGLAAWTFVSGFGGFLDRSVPPYGAYAIDVTARQWNYDFVYPNGYVADTLHVAVGQPIQLNLTSEDVVHGLSVPALRVNTAILPGRISRTWFEAIAADTFTLRSDIYSGDGYSDMSTVLISQSQADFDAWLTRVSDIFSGRTYEEVGELLYTRKGCVACHSTDGSKRVGPSFKELYGHEFETRDGRRITADDAYIRESILEPNASVVAGYEPVMTPYAGQITDREIEAITAWIKTMSSLGGSAAADTTQTPETAEEPADSGQKENE